MTQTTSKTLNRVSRLITLGASMFMVLILSCGFTGWAIYTEIMTTYAEHYQTLINAGFEGLITAPQVVSDRILILISLVPLSGAALVLPILLKAACEIRMLCQEKLDAEEALDNLSHK